MALSPLALQPCCLCCRGKRLNRVIIVRAGRGCRNAFPRKMRSNNFLFKITRSFSRSEHKFTDTFLQHVDEAKLLNKVPALVGYSSFHDFIENDKAEIQAGGHQKDAQGNFDVHLACRRYPSIILGSSPPVELYDDTTHYSEVKSLLAARSYELIQNATGVECIDPDVLNEQWHSLNSSLSEKSRDKSEAREQNTHRLKESDGKNRHSSPSNSCDEPLETEGKLAHKEFSTNLRSESQRNAATLDSSISCIPGLTTRQRRQLEKCGFHTLRKILQHFPRTYADLQNAQVGVDDGQYLISVGKVISSRGVRATGSFSFIEVVVGCEIVDSASQHVNNDVDAGEIISDISRGGMFDRMDIKGTSTIYLHLKKFFRGTRFCSPAFLQCLQDKHRVGEVVCVSGKVRSMRTKGHYEMREYSIDVLNDGDDPSLHAKQRPYPIYPSKGGLNPEFLRKSIVSALHALVADIDPIPEKVTQEFGLLCLRDAYIGIHQPQNVEEADLARKRLIFDEFFYLQLGRLFQMLEGLGTRMEKDGLLDKYRKPELAAVYVEDWSSLTKKFLKALPYSLTSSQLSAVSEIIWDLRRPIPMNRLLQGDVGCGKTVVAFLACMEVIGAGYQAAFMVPTELLAIQHYEHLLNLLDTMEDDQFKPTVALLTGSTPQRQSRMIRKDLQTGDISMVIGTHSLISENVEFSALRIAVVDEQHRFGVVQRGRFNSKLYYSSINSRIVSANLDGSPKGDGHMAPHVLAMSATPIPRTLALALYGDMSLTQITDLPPGRIPVDTHIIEGNHDGFDDIYKMMVHELEAEGRVYLVYPIIEQSEQLPQLRAASADLDVISRRFQEYNCGLLHGKMKSDDKDEALRRFRSGETRILLATQVIEIGVDVPDASMMIVMNAERFGIAQLHQLRGRVGRGTRKSKCILVASTASSLNRLKVLEKSSDGFYLANMDLVLRGPGDLLGKKQSGHLPEFPIARLEIDGNILQDAHAAALKILGESHNLEGFPALKTELSMRQPLCLLGD